MAKYRSPCTAEPSSWGASPPSAHGRWYTVSLPLLLVAGCRAVLGFDDPGALPIDAAVALDATADTPLPGYRATAIRFERAGGDYLTTGKLANTNDAPRGTYSVWLHFQGGDGTRQLIDVAQELGIGGVIRETSNRFHFVMQMCESPVLLDMQSKHTYTASSGWTHVLASWDLTIGRAQLYINEVDDRADNPTLVTGNICYSAHAWGLGGITSAELDADVADLYAALGTSLDLDDPQTRRLFSDAHGKPVDLGAHCEKPTGMEPAGCMTGDPATWFLNKGYGAGFAVNGDGLAVAPSPSD